MKTFSALLSLYEGNLSVTGEFPSQRPVKRSFDVFFDLRPNKRLGQDTLTDRFVVAGICLSAMFPTGNLGRCSMYGWAMY